MKKLLIIVALAVAAYEWNEKRIESERYAAYLASGGAKVELYATQSCGYCKKARELMASNDIAYVEYDIERSDSARAQFK